MSATIQHLLEKLPNEDNYLEFFQRALEHLGIWPFRRTVPRRGWALARHAWNLFVVLLTTLVAFVFLPVAAYRNWGVDLVENFNLAYSPFVYGIVVPNIGCLMIFGERFHQLMATLETMTKMGWQHHERPKEVVEPARWFTRLAGCFYLVCALLIVVFVSILAIFCFLKWDFITRIWLPYDYRQSPYFEMTIFTLLAITAYGLHIVVVVIVLSVAILTQIAFQLALLNHNIVNVVPVVPPESECPVQESKILVHHDDRGQKVPISSRKRSHELTLVVLGKWKAFGRLEEGEQEASANLVGGFGKDNTSRTTEWVNAEAERRLRYCVEHHQVITSLVDLLHAAYGPIILFDLSIVIIPLILTPIFVVYGEEIDLKTFLVIMMTAVGVAQMGLVCFMAERVVDESEGVRDAAYGCNWFDQSESFKRSMRVIMSRCNQPIIFKRLGIPMTLETFHGVLKLTYGYYMSLSTMVNPPH